MTADEAGFVMLRKHGVKSYSDTPGGGFSVEFFLPEAQPEMPKPTNNPELCRCKHHLHIAHVNGLCVEGCSTEECNPETK